MKRGDIIRVHIDCLTPDGTGCAVTMGHELRIKGVLPGDEADVLVLAVRRNTARVKLLSLVSCGIPRIQPQCPHFAVCGGCKWQDVPYSSQCQIKAELVKTSLNNVHGMEPVEHIDIVPSPDVFFYRNKMEFTFDSPPSAMGKVIIGLHVAEKFDRVFDLRCCLLQSELSNKVVEFTREFVQEHRQTAYGLKTHEGLLRFLVIRDGKNTGEIMINCVTSGEEFDRAVNYAERIVREVQGVTTVIRSINRSYGSVAYGEEREILYGDGVLRERIGDFTFIISPDSFFQTNPHQTKKLYDTIKEFSGLTGSENLLDLYCGTGTIGIYLSGYARLVTGVEMAESSISDARINAERNGVTNIKFISGQVENIIDETMGDFDVVICDPPRAGIHPKALNQLLRMRIPRMVYVSCNIKAMANDLEMFAMAGYHRKDILVLDMSPHTPHIETVVLLEIV